MLTDRRCDRLSDVDRSIDTDADRVRLLDRDRSCVADRLWLIDCESDWLYDRVLLIDWLRLLLAECWRDADSDCDRCSDAREALRLALAETLPNRLNDLDGALAY